ncbi:hypothetical protein WA158_004456 [Blastocystis sp. Blastoise]
MFDTPAGQMRPIKEELSSSNAVLKQKTVIEIRLLYIGQTKEEYYEDMNGKYSIDDLIPHFKNGRAMKCKEYKHFIDSLKKSNFNIPYVIEGNSSIIKRLETIRNSSVLVSREDTNVQCSCDGKIIVTSKKEKTLLDNLVIKDINIQKTTNDDQIIILSDSDDIFYDSRKTTDRYDSIQQLVSIHTSSEESSSETKCFSSQHKETTITDFFICESDNSSNPNTIRGDTLGYIQKLSCISHFISDAYTSLLVNSCSIKKSIDCIYSSIPSSYTTTGNHMQNQLAPIEQTTKSTKESDEYSMLNQVSEIYHNPISSIHDILKKNDQLFKIIDTVIRDDGSLVSLCVNTVNERWKLYLDSHLSDIILLISYLVDDLLFYDVEIYKNPYLKSQLKHSDTYNKFIIYNRNNKRWYCASCLLYSTKPMLFGEKYSAIQISTHKNSKLHKSSMKQLKSLLDNMNNNQSLLTTHSGSISTNNYNVWKYFFRIYYNCICTCLSDIHSIYGKNTNIYSSHCGMFLTLLRLTAKNNPLVKQLLDENSDAYLSVRSTQRWIGIISEEMNKSLINSVGNQIYSLTTDGTTCQNMEQLVITIRYCDKSYNIHQYLLSIDEEVSPSGLMISKIIQSSIKEKGLQLDKLCSISYDNCICNTSNIRGIIPGLQVANNSVIGYGCKVHLLNLALLDLENQILDTFNYINIINDIAVSWSRCSRLRVLIKNNGFSLYTLPQVSQTRFTARYYSILPYILHPKQTLCKIFLLYFYSYNKNTVCYKNSEKMLKCIGEVSFHIYIEYWFRILSIVNKYSILLQSDTLTISESINITMELFDSISQLASSNNIKEMYLNAMKRREFIYECLTRLINNFKLHNYDNTSDQSVSSLLDTMKTLDEYKCEYLNLSSSEIKNNEQILESIQTQEDETILFENDIMQNDNASGNTSRFRSNFSIIESITSILNYRDNQENRNYSRMCKEKGLKYHLKKKNRENVLINQDNDYSMAPVADNKSSVNNDPCNDAVITPIKTCTSKEFITYTICKETKKKYPDMEIQQCSNYYNYGPLLCLNQINDDDVDILYDCLILKENHCLISDSTLETSSKENNSSSSFEVMNPSVLVHKRRGRPKKNQESLNLTKNSCDSPEKSLAIKYYGIKRSTIGCYDSLSMVSTDVVDDTTSIGQKEVNVESKRNSILSAIQSNDYSPIFIVFYLSRTYIKHCNNSSVLRTAEGVGERKAGGGVQFAPDYKEGTWKPYGNFEVDELSDSDSEVDTIKTESEDDYEDYIKKFIDF